MVDRARFSAVCGGETKRGIQKLNWNCIRIPPPPYQPYMVGILGGGVFGGREGAVNSNRFILI